MSAMWNNRVISLQNFNDLAHHYDDFVVTDGIGRGNELQERLECISGLNLLDSALHSDCVVTSSLVLHDDSKIKCRTLADSGCTQQCFMSEGYFPQVLILQQYLVQHLTPCHSSFHRCCIQVYIRRSRDCPSWNTHSVQGYHRYYERTPLRSRTQFHRNRIPLC